jgi:hypothetical protein
MSRDGKKIQNKIPKYHKDQCIKINYKILIFNKNTCIVQFKLHLQVASQTAPTFSETVYINFIFALTGMLFIYFS